MSAHEPAAPAPERSATQALLSVALLLEAVLVFFVAMTAFGLRVLPPVPAFVGGAVLIVLLVATGRLVRYQWGIWLGWVLQAVLIGTGILLPVMYVIGAGFAGIWVYCFVKGRQLDAAKLAHLTNPEQETP
jgi:membrane protein YdbS with pleckstrin-like domain